MLHAFNRLADKSDPVQITISDVGKMKQIFNLDLKYFDLMAKALGARNGNQTLEPLQRNKISIWIKFVSFFSEIFF